MAERIKRRVAAYRMPYVANLRDLDPVGVRFELANMVEYHRVIEHGGETEYMSAMLNYLRPDDVLYDIGANLGLLALHAAPTCTVVAFEPDPEIAERLRHNIALNPDRHIKVVEAAVSDTDAPVTLYTDGAAGMSPSLVHQRDEKGQVVVQARTLDSTTDLPAPTILKLDIEGAEILALRGARQLLSGERRPRAIFIEIHDTFLPGFGSSGDEVRTLLAEYGYTVEKYRAPRADQHHLILEASR